MRTIKLSFLSRSSLILLMMLQGLSGTGAASAAPSSPDDSNFRITPFWQNWSNTALISSDDNWSGVPGIIGYRGDDLTTGVGIDPQTILVDGTSTPIDVTANQTDPSLTTEGLAEFEITDPVVALKASDSADAPFLLLSINESGYSHYQVSYNLRDIDSSAVDAVQPVALQYRVGGSGEFTNLPAGFVADATSGLNQAILSTRVSVTLPPSLPLIQIRIITTNAAGPDEWVGIDDLAVYGFNGDEPAPTVIYTSPASISSNVPENTSLTISFNEPVNVTGDWYSITCTTSGTHAAVVNGGPVTFILDPLPTFAKSESCSVTIYAAQVTDQDLNDPPDHMNADFTFNFMTTTTILPESCKLHFPIASVQGSGASSPLENTVLNIEGVVTGDFQGPDHLDGFFLQDGDGTRNPNNSEGIFVYDPDAPDVHVGDLVWVRGLVVEYYGNTELWNIEGLQICGTGQVMAPFPLNPLPTVVGSSLERFENMLITLPQPLTVTDNEFLGQYGEVVVSASGRLYYPNNDQWPDWETNERRRLVVDDGSESEPPSAVPYLSSDFMHTLRLGDTVTTLTGVLTYAYGTYRLHPTIPPAFERTNPRPYNPIGRMGSLRVASMNVGSYFNGDGQGGGFPTGWGADTLQEFDRQRWKVVLALMSLDADVIGLEEIENDGAGSHSAIQDLVNGLTDYMKAPTYALIPEPMPGTSEMKVSLIYRPAVVTPVGPPQNYQAGTASYSALFDRPPLAQLFKNNLSGEKFWVVVNQFTTRENCPVSGPDVDQGDGQGCWNARRVAQATALLSFVASLRPVDPDVLVLGDLNSYGLEDPVYFLEEGGLLNQIAQWVPLEDRYSYVFYGQAGTLDHVFSTSSLDDQVRNVIIRHINADEPQVLDYNLDLNSPNLYNTDYFRSSDHDPVLVDLELSLSGKIYLPLLLNRP